MLALPVAPASDPPECWSDWKLGGFSLGADVSEFAASIEWEENIGTLTLADSNVIGEHLLRVHVTLNRTLRVTGVNAQIGAEEARKLGFWFDQFGADQAAPLGCEDGWGPVRSVADFEIVQQRGFRGSCTGIVWDRECPIHARLVERTEGSSHEYFVTLIGKAQDRCVEEDDDEGNIFIHCEGEFP
jgi:hypothetical protein